MKAIELRASNFKRLTAVRVDLSGSTTVIGGQNGAGKTSTLDAIQAALGGKGAMPEQALRRGAKKGHIVLELDELTVERTFTGETTQLVVTSRDGGKLKSPQAVLDKLVGSLSFDPLAFTRMDPKAQVATLKELAGVDFGPLDAERAKLYDQRTEIGRELKRIEGAIMSMPPVDPKAPVAEVSIATLAEGLDVRKATNRARAEEDAKLVKLRESAARLVDEVAQLKSRLAAAEAELAKTKEEGIAQRAKVDAMPVADEDELVQQMRTAEANNAKARAAAERKKLSDAHRTAMATEDSLTSRIVEIDEQKKTALAESKFSVPGLAFDDRGVTLGGLPFEQGSAAERLRVSVAIGLALNPELKLMLIRDGSLLDKQSRALLAKLAEDAGAQLVIEVVGDDGACTVVIEDGEVRGAEAGAA